MRADITYQTDNSGQVPQLGDYVAYNYSGQIATGYIRHVGTSKRGFRTGLFTIHQVLPEEGHISRIRGGVKCLLVLQTADKVTDAGI